MNQLRVLTTVAEMDELPDGAVVLDDEDVAIQKLDPETWIEAGSNGRYTAEQVLGGSMELRVLWVPVDGAS